MPITMLVADDSVVIQKSIGITFAQEDFAITYVNNGEDAVAKARQLKPDVILADVNMPKLDGYDVCRQLRQEPGLASTPILLLAGTHEPFDEAKGKTSGATGHIVKPFESQALLDRIKGELVRRPAAAAPPPPEAPVPPPAEPSPASTVAGMPAAGRVATPMLELEEIPLAAAPQEPAAGSEAPPDLSAAETAAEPPLLDADSVAAPKEVSEFPPEPPPPADIWDFSAQAPPVELSPAVDFVPVSPSAPEEGIEPAAAEAFEPSAPAETFAPPPEPAWAEPEPFVPAEAPLFAPAAADFPDTPAGFGQAPSVPAPPAGAAPLALSDEQIRGIVTEVFRGVIERIAWEVVPDLAETIIQEELARLTQERS